MDFSPIIANVFKAVWWLVPLAVLLAFLRSPWFKGIAGEFLVKIIAKLRLPEDTYHAIHNVTLPTPDGTTQIDHIIVSRYGVFVIETKNMKGWIFGSEKQAQWTQKIYKQTFKFQNPLRQNYKHTKALESVLDLPSGVIHSVVVFIGASALKTPLPANVTIGGGYVSYINSFRSEVLSDAQVTDIVGRIQEGRLTPSRQTNRQHVERLKQRSNPNAERKCPACGSAMVLRNAKRGKNAGNQFWGCSEYPQCKTVQNFQ